MRLQLTDSAAVGPLPALADELRWATRDLPAELTDLGGRRRLWLAGPYLSHGAGWSAPAPTGRPPKQRSTHATGQRPRR